MKKSRGRRVGGVQTTWDTLIVTAMECVWGWGGVGVIDGWMGGRSGRVQRINI